MAGYSVYPDFEPGRAVDGRHNAKRQTFGFQHRPLFDMGLDEAGDMVRADRTRPVGIAAEGLQSVTHRDAGAVLLVQRVLEIGAGEGARTGERRAKTHALLIAEGDDLDGVVEPLAGCAQPLDNREGRERAVISVVTPGVAHGVDMRPQH